MTTETKHTPTRLEFGDDKNGPFAIVYTRTDNPILHIIPLTIEGRLNFEANLAPFLSHDVLTAALDGCVEALETLMTRFEHTGHPWMHEPAMVQARAALDAAKKVRG